MGPELYRDYLWWFPIQGERSMKDSFWKTYLSIFALTPLLAWAGIGFHGLSVRSSVSSEIEMAGTSPTLSEMHQHLGVAIKQIEALGWTQGYTSVFVKSEDENVGAWHDRLVKLYDTFTESEEVYYDQEIGLEGEPAGIRVKTISLGLVNSAHVLQNARGVLLTPQGNSRMPEAMSFFPNNQGMAALMGIGIPMFLVGLIYLIAKHIP